MMTPAASLREIPGTLLVLESAGDAHTSDFPPPISYLPLLSYLSELAAVLSG